MSGDINSNNNNINVRAKITLHFYGGLLLAIVAVFALVYFSISAHSAFVVVLVGIGSFIGIVIVVFVSLEVAHKAVRVHGDHRKTVVLHADEHRLVLLEGNMFSKKPVVYETDNTRYNYNIKQVDAPQVIEEETKLLPAPKPPLPSIVRYEEIKPQIPRGHALVGVSEDGVETKEDAVKGLIWVVGSSGSGKSNTVSLRVEEDYQRGHRFLGIDPHIFKDDSLTNSIRGYMDKFLAPMAYKPEDILQVLNYFLAEFERRKSGSKCWPLTLLIDEIGSLTSDKPEDEIEEQIISKIKQLARIAGQETRGFNMNVTMISQDAAGLSWLRKRALMVLGHKVLMMSERELVCNKNMEIARDMDNWPKGRTVVYGVAFPYVRVLQQPLFSSGRVVEAGTIEPLQPKPVSVSGNTGNSPETLLDAELPQNVRAFPTTDKQEALSLKKETDAIGNETRETIKRMRSKGVSHRDVAYCVGLSGRKYSLYQQVCREEGILEEA